VGQAERVGQVERAGKTEPRSIVFDLFGDHLRYHGGGARTQALVELLGVFGVGEPTARIVLARMHKEGWFATHREGRQVVYTLTDKSWRLLDEGRTRIFERALGPWDGRWRMVIYAVTEQDRTERERLRRTLSWLGFGPLATATWISPHERLDQVEQALSSDSAVRVDLLTCQSRSRAADLEMVDRCWDLKTLGRDYEDLVGRLTALPAAGELAALPGAEALRLRIELVAGYRHFPFRDPDLPGELLPPDWPGSRAHELFLAAHDALAAPADALVTAVLERHASLSRRSAPLSWVHTSHGLELLTEVAMAGRRALRGTGDAHGPTRRQLHRRAAVRRLRGRDDRGDGHLRVVRCHQSRR
jgi:phenylacetic acid degradation operon negative regulatory protein